MKIDLKTQVENKNKWVNEYREAQSLCFDLHDEISPLIQGIKANYLGRAYDLSEIIDELIEFISQLDDCYIEFGKLTEEDLWTEESLLDWKSYDQDLNKSDDYYEDPRDCIEEISEEIHYRVDLFKNILEDLLGEEPEEVIAKKWAPEGVPNFV